MKHTRWSDAWCICRQLSWIFCRWTYQIEQQKWGILDCSNKLPVGDSDGEVEGDFEGESDGDLVGLIDGDTTQIIQF